MTPDGAARPARPSARRGLLFTAAGCALGGAAALGAASLTWARVEVARPSPLPEVHRDLAGGDIEPLLGALGLVLLAGVVGLAATRRRGRVVIGALIALAGVGVAVVAARQVGGTDPQRLAALVDSAVAADPGQLSAQQSVWWPLLAVAGGLVGAASGVAIAVFGRRWPGLGASYDAPLATSAAARPEGRRSGDTGDTDDSDGPVSQREFWDALDQGLDPTDPTDTTGPGPEQDERPPPGEVSTAGYDESAELPPRGRGRRERSR